MQRIQALVGRPRGSAEAAAAPRERSAGVRNEIGWGGAKVFGGIVLDEYNPDLKGRLALQTADKMRRTSGQVRALEQVIRLPIESTQWIVEEPRNAGSAEREAAELLRDNLFGGMEQPFSSVVREACLAIHFGFRVPEIVWEERAGLVAVADIASRNPELVERWVYDERGRLAGYVYAGNRPVASEAGAKATQGEPPTATTRFERVVVPLEKTVHFVHDAENGNPQGFGLWRSQYPHWYFYQALLKILGIGIERNLLGVPIGKQGDGAQDDDRQSVLTTLRRLRAAEDAAITLPPGWNLEWFESQRSLMDAMPFLHHHNAMMAQVGLAQFLSLGQSTVGTQALAREHTEIFQMAEEGRASWIEETLNRQLVRRWCGLNYPSASGQASGIRPPVLRHRKIAARDLGAWTQALNALVQGQFLQPGKDDEELRAGCDGASSVVGAWRASAAMKERETAASGSEVSKPRWLRVRAFLPDAEERGDRRPVRADRRSGYEPRDRGADAEDAVAEGGGGGGELRRRGDFRAGAMVSGEWKLLKEPEYMVYNPGGIGSRLKRYGLAGPTNRGAIMGRRIWPCRIWRSREGSWGWR